MNITSVVFLSSLALMMVLLVRRFDRRKDHRSVMQLIILGLYKFARRAKAVAVAADYSYLSGRETFEGVMAAETIEIENERRLGFAFPARADKAQEQEQSQPAVL